MSETTTWPGLHDPAHSQWYIDRFATAASNGGDITGEARLVDAMCERRARILDAGCGPGRHVHYLAGAGHDVVGVDIDPRLVAEGRRTTPNATWLVGDLAHLDLPAQGVAEGFDAILCAGNVLDFVTEPYRPGVIAGFARHLKDDGFVLIGCRTSRGVTPAELDTWLAGAGLECSARYATWTLRPWHAGADFAVSVLRRAR